MTVWKRPEARFANVLIKLRTMAQRSCWNCFRRGWVSVVPIEHYQFRHPLKFARVVRDQGGPVRDCGTGDQGIQRPDGPAGCFQRRSYAGGGRRRSPVIGQYRDHIQQFIELLPPFGRLDRFGNSDFQTRTR